MRTIAASVCLVALSCFSVASAYFWVGNTDNNSVLLLSHTEHIVFKDGNKARVAHINTCKENNIIIDKIEVKTTSGKTVEGKVIKGGAGDFYAAVELKGEKEATCQLIVWGTWKDGEPKDVDIPNTVKFFDNYWPCSHKVD